MKSFSITDVGMKRSVNQDYVYKTDEPVGFLENLYVVADGMGGHKAGDFASKFTVEYIREDIKNSAERNPVKLLERAVINANNALLEKAQADPDLLGTGTTVVAATMRDDVLYFANVGDSRLYLINQGIRQLSKDHSLVEEMVRLGGIKPEEAKDHPDKNIITRAIGAKMDVQVDTFEHRMEAEDKILMCSDGLSNMVHDNEIFELVQGSRDMVEALEQLVSIANKHGGNDNIGIVLFKPVVGEVSIC